MSVHNLIKVMSKGTNLEVHPVHVDKSNERKLGRFACQIFPHLSVAFVEWMCLSRKCISTIIRYAIQLCVNQQQRCYKRVKNKVQELLWEHSLREIDLVSWTTLEDSNVYWAMLFSLRWFESPHKHYASFVYKRTTNYNQEVSRTYVFRGTYALVINWPFTRLDHRLQIYAYCSS